MNEISRKKFLLEISDDNQYRIFPKNNGILILKSASNSSWSEVAFLNNMHPCFYAAIDSRDIIHIVSQDQKGSIIYSKIEKGILTSSKVLESTPVNPFDRSFFMLFKNNSPVFFYTVQKQFDKMLVCQFISGKKASTPIPLYKVPDTVNSYWITSIWQNTGLILFPKVSGLYTQIFAGIFRLDTLGNISEKVITAEDANCESPKCIVLPDGGVHMIFLVRKGGKFYLKYQKGTSRGLDFSASETIAVSRQAFTKINLEYSNDTLNINWLEDGYIYYRNKKSTESKFSEIMSYKSYKLRFIEYYHCMFSKSSQKRLCYSTEQPLSIDGRVQYAFYREAESPPVKKEKKMETKKQAPSSPEGAVFRALCEYLASREDISIARQNKIEKLGDIIVELSSILSKNNTERIKKEKNEVHKAPPQNGYSLRKTQGKLTYKLKK